MNQTGSAEVSKGNRQEVRRCLSELDRKCRGVQGKQTGSAEVFGDAVLTEEQTFTQVF